MSNESVPTATATGEPLLTTLLFDEVRVADGLRLGMTADRGVAILAPLPLGVTLDAVPGAPTQRGFLEFISSNSYLVAYDQRGAGGSAGDLTAEHPEVLGRDLWQVAAAAGIERAVLYGVLDAGLTVIEAARQQPDRVLGVILNFVPPGFGVADGVTEETLTAWCSGPDGALDTSVLLLDLGLPEADRAAFSAAPVAERGGRERLRLLRAMDAQALASCAAPVLIIEPARSLYAGWGDALVGLQPAARLVHTVRGARALGAIDAFMARCTDEHGEEASRITPEQARTSDLAASIARNIRTVMVPVDEEFTSARAVDLACRLAEIQDAVVTLVSVEVIPRVRALDDPAPEAESRAREALRVASAVAARRGKRSATRIQRARGYVDGIVRASEECGADVIVLPNPSSPLGRQLDDEALQELFARAPCEVLVDRSGRAGRIGQSGMRQ